MNRNRFHIVTLLMMILIIVVALTVTTDAVVVAPPTASLPTTSTTPLPEFILPSASASSPPEPILPDEPTMTQQPDMPAEDITPPDAAVPLTPDGNLTLIDDINSAASESKQFLTVTTKAGNTFYLVIDHAANKENVYFLNLVDEADLLTLIKDKDSLAGASGNGAVPIEPEPSGNPFGNPNSIESVKPATSHEPVTGEAKQPDKTTAYFALGLIVLLLLAGGTVWFFKLRKPKKPAGSGSYLDEYDFGDEEDASFDPNEHRAGATKDALDLDRLPETDFQPVSAKDGKPEHGDDGTIYKFDNIGKNTRKQEENPR